MYNFRLNFCVGLPLVILYIFANKFPIKICLFKCICPLTMIVDIIFDRFMVIR